MEQRQRILLEEKMGGEATWKMASLGIAGPV